jgi:hypothetical protein
MSAAGISPKRVHQKKAEEPSDCYARHEPPDPSAGPFRAEENLDEVGEKNDEIRERERREDVLREHLERARIFGIVGQRGKVSGNHGEEDPGIDHERDDDPDADVGAPTHAHSEELVEGRERDDEADIDDAREYDRSKETEEKAAIVLPEGE